MKFRKEIIRLCMVWLSATIFVAGASAQGVNVEQTQEAESDGKKDSHSMQEDIAKHPLKPPDTSSPRATLLSFLDNANAAYRVVMAAHRQNVKAPGLFTPESIQQMQRHAEELFQRAVYCLNLSEVADVIKKSWGYEGTLFLKEILDRIELPPFEEIPDAQAIEAEIEHQKIAGPLRWRLPNTEIVIAMVEDGPRQGEFLFAPEIIPRLDEFVEKVKHLPYKSGPSVSPGFLELYDSTPGGLLPPGWSRWLPAWSTTKYYFQPLWKWCMMIGLLLMALVLIWAFYRWWKRKAGGFSGGKQTWGRAAIILGSAVAALLVLNVLTVSASV